MAASSNVEEHPLVFGQLIFDYDSKCFFLNNGKDFDKAVRLWPANMKKIVKELPRIVMEAREEEQESLKILEMQADLLEKGECIEELSEKNKDQVLSSFKVCEWEEEKEGKIGKFSIKVETYRYIIHVVFISVSVSPCSHYF